MNVQETVGWWLWNGSSQDYIWNREWSRIEGVEMDQHCGSH